MNVSYIIKCKAMSPKLIRNTSICKIILLAVSSFTLLSFNLYAQEHAACTFLDLGVKYYENLQYSEAIDAFKHAIKLKPGYAEAYYNLGHVYYNLHRYTEAFDAYKEAVKVKPDYAEAYISLGIVSSMLSRYDEATEALKKAVKINPKNAEAYYRLGNVYSELHKTEEAIDAFRQAVKINPDFAEVHYNLGIAYLDLRTFVSSRQESVKREYEILKKLNQNLAEELRKQIEAKQW